MILSTTVSIRAIVQRWNGVCIAYCKDPTLIGSNTESTVGFIYNSIYSSSCSGREVFFLFCKSIPINWDFHCGIKLGTNRENAILLAKFERCNVNFYPICRKMGSFFHPLNSRWDKANFNFLMNKYVLEAMFVYNANCLF